MMPNRLGRQIPDQNMILFLDLEKLYYIQF